MSIFLIQIVKDSSATQNYWKVSEENIEGVCDVIYQINELPEYIVKERSEYFPQMEACSSKKFFEVTKTKEIDSCRKSAFIPT
ncbi:Vitellogenin 2 [Caligus rogercresseyi]|uniref:Vitellogenin 2 n=1 Tax=Caligus rogercresseyi TaxID=217165 RepID=A0A7T8KGT0_CALRO|nr:Vitellogenin 2 [Caligus rogercresseyi]